MEPDKVVSQLVDVLRSIVDLFRRAITSVIDFLREHPEVLVFAAGFFIGYKVGMFFGKDKAEEDVFSYLEGGMKLDD